MADAKINLDRGDLGRLERGAAKAENAGKFVTKAADNAQRFAGNLIRRFGNLARKAEGFLEGTGLESQARQASDVALGGLAGARTGAALLGAIPLPGSGLAGAALGGALGVELSRKIEAGRVAGEAGVKQAELEATLRQNRLGNVDVEAAQARGLREVLAKVEQDRKRGTVDFGQGDPARTAAMRRAVRGGL